MTAVGQTVDVTLESIDAFVRSVVVPLEDDHADLLSDPLRRYTASGRYCDEVLDLKRRLRMAAAERGLYTLFTPLEFGGGGGGPLLHYRVWEHLYRTCGPDRILPYDVIAHLSGGPSPALAGLSPVARRDVLPGLLSGETILCFALSEEHGGDPRLMKTAAARDGGEWVIHGSKHWTSRGPYADYMLVFARTDGGADEGPDDGGVTAFLVPADSPGLRVETVVRLWGRAGGEEATLVFDGLRASEAQIVGRLHEGLDVIASVSGLGAMFTAGRFVGLARWALERTSDHARADASRTEVPVDPQLAESVIEVHAAHLMALDCARRLEDGDPARLETSMLWIFGPEMAGRTYERCMLAHGGVGLTSAARLFDGLHQSRIVQLADAGARKRNLARQLLHGELSFA